MKRYVVRVELAIDAEGLKAALELVAYQLDQLTPDPIVDVNMLGAAELIVESAPLAPAGADIPVGDEQLAGVSDINERWAAFNASRNGVSGDPDAWLKQLLDEASLVAEIGLPPAYDGDVTPWLADFFIGDFPWTDAMGRLEMERRFQASDRYPAIREGILKRYEIDMNEQLRD